MCCPLTFSLYSVERDCACVYVNISVYTLISVFSPPQLWNSSSHYCTHTFICTLVCICTPMTKVFPHFLTHCSAWPYCRERERESLRSWCNCLVTPSPALWVIALRSKLWGLEPLVDLQRGPYPQGWTACIVNASFKRPGNSRATNALRFHTVSWAECQVGCFISYHCEAENEL